MQIIERARLKFEKFKETPNYVLKKLTSFV
jgi:hypothetical protein